MPTYLKSPLAENDLKEVENRWKALSNLIQYGDKVNDLIPDLAQLLKEVFDCEVITLFGLDRANRQLFSRNEVTEKYPEIRIDISRKSIAGFVSAVGMSLNIENVHDKEELLKYHPDLKFDPTWDKKLNFKTKSIMAIPLPHNKKLVGVLEVINKNSSNKFSEKDFRRAKEISPILGQAMSKLDLEKLEVDSATKSNLERQEKFHAITQAIHSARNVDEILIEQKNSILELFDAESITIYAVQSEKNEIVSKVKSGDSINEIRVPISPRSIAGFVALEQKRLNLKDVYDDKELKKIHAELSFDGSWDKKTGYRTRSMLVYPLIFDNQLMGIIQLINKKEGDQFNALDEQQAQLMSETLALAFFNQRKFVKQVPTKFSYLIYNGLISVEELTNAIAKARKSNLDPQTILANDHGIKRKEIGKSLSDFYKLPYFGYDSSFILPGNVFEGLNKNYLAKNFWVPLSKEGQKVEILIDDPNNQEKIQNIKLIFPKQEIIFKVGLRLDIWDYLNASVGETPTTTEAEEYSEEISSLLDSLKNEKDDMGIVEDDVEEDSAISDNDSTIVRLVNKVITDAYASGVSDIHVEPGVGKENMLVRFRKDGACRQYEEIPHLYKQAFVSRLKIMSKLDIAEKRLPQDGKIKMKYGAKEIELRVATCPTVGGNEDVVMRILAASKPIPLDKMNFSDRNLHLIQGMVKKPYGLILVVGPTGSGKTTTLHSCLGYINEPDRKIWTAEYPVEITQKGLRQVQMHSKIGLDFARAMRSFLRGDPDVIMVGEMRDSETCSIGLEASLTGHLVFSTLHTNSAPETITRLLDMGMNPLNFADALLLIVAQRLVRTLCKECKEAYNPTEDEFQKLVQEYGASDFSKLGIEYSKDLALYRPVGCSKCSDTGYSGRTGLHELLEGTPDIKRMVMKKELVEKLRAQAIGDGMTTLKQDGIWKIFKGQCDLKQVLAVCIA